MFPGLSAGRLRSRLVLLVLLAVLPVVTASTVANLQQRSTALERFVDDARQTTTAVAADLNRLVDSVHQLLTVLQDIPAIRAGGPLCGHTLAGLLTVHPYLTNLGVVDLAGAPVCSARPDASDPRRSAWFTRASTERDLVVANGGPQAGTGQHELVLAHPMMTNGAVSGVLYARLNLAWLDRLLGTAAVANTAVSAVIDREGLILYRSQQPEEFVGTRVSADVLQRIRDSDRAGTETSGFDGVVRRFVTATWGGPPKNALLLAVGYPTASAVRPFNRILLMQSLFLGVGVLVAMLAVNRAARRLVLNPVEALVSAITRVRAGDLTARVAPAGGAELKELSAAFNLAVEGLERSRDLEEQLRHAQRLQAIGHLAGGVAHEFNNMLTVILGHTESLLEDEPGRPEFRAIHDAAERSRGLTHQLLAFSRRQLLQPRRARLSDAVRASVGALAQTLGARITVDLQFATPDPEVMIDRTQFDQVVLNLLLNARDAMPEGGIITVQTSVVPVVHGNVPGLSDGLYAHLAISDTGHGMDADTLARALEPFFTTKPFGQGAGLGLATAYGIIRQSGGQLTLSSTPGAGTSAHVYLPVLG